MKENALKKAGPDQKKNIEFEKQLEEDNALTRVSRNGASSVCSSVNVKSKNGYLFIKHEEESPEGSRRSSQKLRFQQRPFNRFKYFESLPKYSKEQPMSTSSPYMGSPEQIFRREEQENKKKWISGIRMKNYFGGK